MGSSCTISVRGCRCLRDINLLVLFKLGGEETYPSCGTGAVSSSIVCGGVGVLRDSDGEIHEVGSWEGGGGGGESGAEEEDEGSGGKSELHVGGL